MAEVTIDSIKELRERTGVGMMECKNSLIEADGDIDKAIRILKEKGAITAAKKGERTIKEGLIGMYLSDDKKLVSIVEVQCETDFVAKNEVFQNLTQAIANHVSITNAKDAEELMTEKIDGGTDTIKDMINAAIQKLGENMDIGRFMKFSTDGFFATYMHFNKKTAVILEIVNGVCNDETLEIAGQIAMHAASDKPVAATRDALEEATVVEQYEIFKKLTVDAGKPENMVEKITEGKMNSWYGESILIDQKLFTDNKITIKSLVDQISKISTKDCTFGTYLLFNIGKK